MVGRQKIVVQKHRFKALNGDWNALKQKLRLSVLLTHERNSPTQIIQKRSVRLIYRTQCLDLDRLEVIVSPQSCVFRLFVRSCHLRHTARTLHGKINVRVSRGANNCHVPRQEPAAFKKYQRLTIWSLAVLAYQANWLIIIIISSSSSSSSSSSRSRFLLLRVTYFEPLHCEILRTSVCDPLFTYPTALH